LAREHEFRQRRGHAIESVVESLEHVGVGQTQHPHTDKSQILVALAIFGDAVLVDSAIHLHDEA
jgi:hypothetical protein